MKGALPLRNPAGAAAALDTSSTNVTNSAWVQINASTANGASAICVSNGGSQPLALATGAAAAEVATGIVIPPSSFAIMLPIEIPKATRLSLKSLGGTQSSGIVTCSIFV